MPKPSIAWPVDSAPNRILIDACGLWSYDRTVALPLFALIAARYERSTIIQTSNKRLAE